MPVSSRSAARPMLLVVLALALVALFSLRSATRANATPNPVCDPALTGTTGADVIVGTPGDDHICGLDGNDVLIGLGGTDIIEGGPGNDLLQGGAGDDTLDGGADTDTVSYSDDPAGPTTRTFGFLRVDLTGNAVAACQTLTSPCAWDEDGNLGTDTIVAFGGVSTVENVIGSPFADKLIGNGDSNSLVSLAGDDFFVGHGGNDTEAGGPDNDRLQGGIGADQLEGDGGNDIANGGGDADSVQGGSGNDVIRGNAGADTLVGGFGNDRVLGGAGDDLVRGSDNVTGNDIVHGDADTDACDSDTSDTVTTCESVAAANVAPLAVDDSFTTTKNIRGFLAASGVLGNDSDPDFTPAPGAPSDLRAAVATGPAHGTLTLYGDGSFDYTPDANYNGPDSFTYTVSDGVDTSAPAMVSITVNP